MGDYVMRVTIDLDSQNPIKLFFVLSKGCVLCRRLPYFIRLTRKGFHCGWRHLNISDDDMYRYRYIIGDDRKRIELDKNNETLVKQVLFIHKKVYVHKDGKRELVSWR